MSGAPPPPILPAADLLLDQYIRLAQEIVDGAAPQVRVCFLCVAMLALARRAVRSHSA